MDTETPSTPAPQHLRLADGRRLAYAEYGGKDGPPVLYCHGFPSSHREARLLEPAARRLGVRLITLDRPGYGGSDACPERTLLDWADDCAAVLDRLGLARTALVGVSGGGPFALACAARIPERFTTCTLVCPLGPVYRTEVLAAMPGPARAALQLVRRAPRLGRLVYGPPVSDLLARWPTLIERIRDAAAPPIDRDLLAEPRIRTIMNTSLRDALGRGARGARRDIRLYTQPWGFDIADIDLPIDLWHGEIDGTVPVAHARWYAGHLRRCTPHILPGEGHFSLPVQQAETILTRLIERAAAAPPRPATPEIDGRPASP
ncbi:alpha/beta fold hydrolase [Thiococcus pfennigii]|uniref:alpha/beta fold hydrolase n=1 Tax=Thiococcus pfennigii TaxID=1057 RepID=UPI0019032636|nr:alpha/beta hydrolase [Thiococcus pfennigii]MBK1731072.1 alpha/beta hydrolase [Thiococcus pfennigii]